MLRKSNLLEEGGVVTLFNTIHDGWESGVVWFQHCLNFINVMLTFIEDYITPLFNYIFTNIEVLYKY